MIITTPSSGWDAEIFATDSGPPEELSEWGDPVGEVVDASDVVEADLDVKRPSRYFLIWITKVSPTYVDTGYNLEIEEVTLNS